MCQKIEDCLLSKIGFRVFLCAVFFIVFIVLLLNFQFLTSTKQTTDIGNELLSKIKDTQVDERESTSVLSNIKNSHNNIVNKNFKMKTKILILMTAFDETKGSRTSFYSEFSHRVRELRRKECPILKECSFTSHRDKLSKADGVVVVGSKNVSTKEEYTSYRGSITKNKKLNSFLVVQDYNAKNYETSMLNNKTWTLLVQNPLEQRNIKMTSKYIKSAFGVQSIDYLISYMPNADIPLIKFSLSKKFTGQNQNGQLKNTNKLTAYSDYIKSTLVEKIKRRNYPSQAPHEISNDLMPSIVGQGITVLNKSISLLDKNKNIPHRDFIFKSNNLTGGSRSVKYGRGTGGPETAYVKNNKSMSNKKHHRQSEPLFRAEQRRNRLASSHGQELRSAIRKKRAVTRTTTTSSGMRLAAVIMNTCISEGNREGKRYYVNIAILSLRI